MIKETTHVKIKKTNNYSTTQVKIFFRYFT